MINSSNGSPTIINKKRKKMLDTTRSLTVSTLFLCLAFATYGVAQAQETDPCERSAKTFKLKIKVRDDKPTKVTRGLLGRNADTLNVCRGDTIEWKLSGKKFYIDFPRTTPFSANKKNSENNKVSWTVSADAARGDSYKYDVGIVGGGVLDPIIIVD